MVFGNQDFSRLSKTPNFTAIEDFSLKPKNNVNTLNTNTYKQSLAIGDTPSRSSM